MEDVCSCRYFVLQPYIKGIKDRCTKNGKEKIPKCVTFQDYEMTHFFFLHSSVGFKYTSTWSVFGTLELQYSTDGNI